MISHRARPIEDVYNFSFSLIPLAISVTVDFLTLSNVVGLITWNEMELKFDTHCFKVVNVIVINVLNGLLILSLVVSSPFIFVSTHIQMHRIHANRSLCTCTMASPLMQIDSVSWTVTRRSLRQSVDSRLCTWPHARFLQFRARRVKL